MINKALIKKILWFILLGLIGLVLLLLLTIFVFSDKIGEKAIQAIQDTTTSEIAVGQSRLSFLTYFPKAGIKLKDVSIKDTNQEVLFNSEEITFKINLASLIGAKLNLQSVKIKNATLRIIKDEKGKWNYNIFKTKEGGNEPEFRLDIHKALLEYCEIIYEDRQEDFSTSIFLLKAGVNFNYTTDEFLIAMDARSVLDHITVGNDSFLIDKSLTFKINLTGNLNSNKYIFENSSILMSGNAFSLLGSIDLLEKSTIYDIELKCESAELNQLIQLLPNEQNDLYSQLSPKGIVKGAITYRGKSSSTNQPELNVNFDLTDGFLTSSRLNTKLENLNAFFHLKNTRHNTSINFATSGGTLQKHPLSVKGVVDLNKYSSYSIDISAKVPVFLVSSLAGLTVIDKASGDIYFNNVLFRYGPKYKTPSQGNIKGENLKIRWHGESLEIPTASIHLDQELIVVEDFQLKGWKSELSVKGQVKDYMSLMNENKSTSYDLSIATSRLDVDRWISFFNELNKDEPETETVEAPTNEFFISYGREKAHIQLDLNDIKYESLRIGQLAGRIELGDNHLIFDLDTKAFGGEINAKGNGELKEDLVLNCYLSGKKVNLEQLLFQFDEFDQEFVTSKHLKGNLESKLYMDLYWDKNGNFMPEKFEAKAALIVTDGSLNNLPILEEFSTFVKTDDLRKVKFTTLHNLLEIKNREVFIPEMFIQSNALNMNLCGTHTFDLQMDYALQVNAGQVVMNKFKKHNPSLTPNRARKKGLFNLNYRISGFPENFQYATDKKTVSKMLEDSDRKRDQIRNFLISKFGPNPIFFDSSMEKLDFFQTDAETETYIDF